VGGLVREGGRISCFHSEEANGLRESLEVQDSHAGFQVRVFSLAQNGLEEQIASEKAQEPRNDETMGIALLRSQRQIQRGTFN
jgi:hypothetical protein